MTKPQNTRYVVTLSRIGLDQTAISCELVAIGPFRTRERAEQRAQVIRRLAEQYEDPEGTTGPENALSVVVEPLARGALSAQAALDALYG